LQRAAAAEGMDVICLDNRYNAKSAQRNADVFVREKVDLVIEFQTDVHVAPIVAAKYREAKLGEEQRGSCTPSSIDEASGARLRHCERRDTTPR
jgi:hypothetical protein